MADADVRLASPDEFAGDLEYCVLAALAFEGGEQVGRLGVQVREGKALLGPLECSAQDKTSLLRMWRLLASEIAALGIAETFAPVYEGNTFLQDALVSAGFAPHSITINMRYDNGK